MAYLSHADERGGRRNEGPGAAASRPVRLGAAAAGPPPGCLRDGPASGTRRGGDRGLPVRARRLRLREPGPRPAPGLERRLRELLPGDGAGSRPVPPLRPVRAGPTGRVGGRVRPARATGPRPAGLGPAGPRGRADRHSRVRRSARVLGGARGASEGELRLERLEHGALADVARRRRLPAGAPGAAGTGARRGDSRGPPGAAHDHQLPPRGHSQPRGPGLRSPAGRLPEAEGIEFLAYDPNDPGTPFPLYYDDASRAFWVGPLTYSPPGRVRAFRLYTSPLF